LATGGASWIGRASVVALSSVGAAVAVLDRDEPALNAVVAQVKESGGKASAIIIDLSVTSRIPDSGACVLQEFGRIDFLINCAGVAGKFQPLLEIEDQNWDFVHTVNLKAPMLLMKHVARHMIDRGGSRRIVNLSSRPKMEA
jgi:NAD(P)-dependent dehydrogenase (short-subunit alcohol dehydrogenase family)